MEERLNKIFYNINDWLKFAEAKNGGLLALNGVILIGGLNSIKDIPAYLITPIKWIIIPIFIISTLVLIVSFLPIRDKFFKRTYNLSSNKINEINLLFFGDIKHLTSTVFLRLVYEASNTNIPDKFPKFEKDMAYQIINNSRITDRKLSLFTVAAYIDLIGIIMCIIVLVDKIY